MKTHPRNVVPLLLWFALANVAFAQSRPEEKGNKPTGSISGRVMIGDKPAPGIAIVLVTSDFGPIRKSIAQATTDSEGRFQLSATNDAKPTLPLASQDAGRADLLREAEISGTALEFKPCQLITDYEFLMRYCPQGR